MNMSCGQALYLLVHTAISMRRKGFHPVSVAWLASDAPSRFTSDTRGVWHGGVLYNGIERARADLALGRHVSHVAADAVPMMIAAAGEEHALAISLETFQFFEAAKNDIPLFRARIRFDAGEVRYDAARARLVGAGIGDDLADRLSTTVPRRRLEVTLDARLDSPRARATWATDECLEADMSLYERAIVNFEGEVNRMLEKPAHARLH